MSRQRVAVIGGGIIGLSCAEELVRAGHEVTVLDPTPGGGATRAAAGMLAPAGEAWFGEGALLRLGRESAARWPSFAESLEARSGLRVDLQRNGTLLVGYDRDDLTDLRRTAALVAEHDIPVEELDRRQLRAREPSLSLRVAGAAYLPDDHHVNPRRVAAALLRVLGDRVLPHTGTPADDGVLLGDGTRLAVDVVVRATGATGMPGVRPVRGEVIRARSDDPPRRVLRARVRGERVYVVPRADGEVVIGATDEEHAAAQGEPRPTIGGAVRLIQSARTLLPGLENAELLEVMARDRPGSPDNGPLIGTLASRGRARVLVAGGHYRGGVLLAPVTAAAVRAHVEGTAVPDVARPFTPDRFEPDRFEPDRFEPER